MIRKQLVDERETSREASSRMQTSYTDAQKGLARKEEQVRPSSSYLSLSLFALNCLP